MSRSRKIAMMLVALLGAVLLWLYVVTFVTPEDTITVSSIPISIDNLNSQNLIITEQDKTSLTVDVRTSRIDRNKLNANTITIHADAGKITEPGVYELTCKVVFPDDVTSAVQVSKSETVTVTVTQFEEKTVDVELKWEGALKDGFLMESAEFDPKQITISGPESDVSQVAQAIVRYNVSDLEETVEETLPVVFLNEAGEEIQFSSEATKVGRTEVKMILPVYRTKMLTLSLDVVEGGGIKAENVELEIVPDTIWVKGPDEELDQLEDVFTIGTLDLADLKDMAEQEQRTFPMNLPAGISNTLNETDAVVTVRVTGVTRQTINISDIRLVNPPSDYEYQSFTSSVRVTVRGSEEDIQKILSDASNGVYIRVDLTEYTDTGVYLIPSEVISEKYPGIAAVDPVSIGVVVSEPEPEPQPTTEAPTGDEG